MAFLINNFQAMCLARDLHFSNALPGYGLEAVRRVPEQLVPGDALDHAPLELSINARTGPGQWLGEGVATFGLVLTILGCLRFRPTAVPCGVGLFIAAGYWFTSSTSFANPAVTIGRAFTDSFSGIAPAHVPAFIVCQCIGAALAVVLAAWLLRPARKGKDT